MNLHIGTSGWSYPHWRGLFYPEDLPAKDWFGYYGRQFCTVEINMTFYRYPNPETLKGWMEKAPPGFTFGFKANRRITHIKRIKDVGPELRYFYILADNLKKKLGCILFQLPPSIRLDLPLLRDFIETLSPDYKNVIEFRHVSWFDEKTYDLLRERGVIFCNASSAKVPHTAIKTADTVYFRFHGLTGGYMYRYTDEELAEWADRIRKTEAAEAFAYFNNDYEARAVENARTLARLLE